MGKVLSLFEDSELPKKSNVKEEAKEVLEFLNTKAGKRFRPVDVNLNFIMARLNEGMTVQDLKAIVAMKVREWKDDNETRKYLRPATLFNREKCEQYYGQLDD